MCRAEESIPIRATAHNTHLSGTYKTSHSAPQDERGKKKNEREKCEYRAQKTMPINQRHPLHILHTTGNSAFMEDIG